MTFPDQVKRIRAWVLFLLIIATAALLRPGNTVSASDNITNSTNTTIDTALYVFDSAGLNLTYTDDLVLFYANYSSAAGPVYEANCTINTIAFNYSMWLNSSSGIYMSLYSFAYPGNYTYNVSCSGEGYAFKEGYGALEILPAIIPEPENSTNLTIDADGDGYPAGLDCDDNLPDVNPGQPEIYYNGRDDDCNLDTPDYIIFSLQTDRQAYSPGEKIAITIVAPNRSDTYITMNTPTNISYVYIISNATYPYTQNYTLTAVSGNYSIDGINYYGNYTNLKTVDFSVENTMNVEIKADKTEAYEGEKIRFKAEITGAVGTPNMIWRMDDNNERYSVEFDYNYSGARDYNVVLIVTDQGGNQIVKSKKITVLKQYYLKVKAVDNSTGNIIADAKIILGSSEKTVNSTGEAEFKVTNKTYELEVSSEDYYTYSEDIKINNSLYFTVKLVKRADLLAPYVSLISPANNSQTSDRQFRFKFQDDTTAKCILYVSDGSGWWNEINSSSGLSPNTEYAFSAYLEDRPYKWRIACRDEDNNIGQSLEYSVNFSPSEKQEAGQEEADTTYNVVQNVYDMMPEIEKYGPDDQKVAAYLNIDTMLKDAKRKLEMANRDLFNLKYEPNTESILQKRDEIYNKIEQIKDETPQSVRTTNKVEFIKYIDDSEVESLAEEYLGIKAQQISGSEKKRLIEALKMLQKKASIQTYGYEADITYISGRVEKITLISRLVDIDSPSQDLMLVEFIPKELMSGQGSISFITSPEKVLKENIFEIQLSKSRELTYYMRSGVGLNELPKIKPLIASLSPAQAQGNSITGFAVFDNLGFSDSNKKIFIIQIIIVFILLSVYLFFYFRSSDTLVLPSLKSTEKPQSAYVAMPAAGISRPVSLSQEGEGVAADRQKVEYILTVLDKARGNMNAGRVEDAAMNYYEVKFLYGLLADNDKAIVYQEIILLSDIIHSRHIEGLIDKALIELAMGNHGSAVAIYEEIEEEFPKLTLKHQERLYARCCELALHINKTWQEGVYAN